MLSRLAGLLLAGLLLLLAGCSVHIPRGGPAPAACLTERVKDGDSVLARCDGEAIEIRLVCVDAPELGQRHYGAAAKRALARYLGAEFRAMFEGHDRYGRVLATLWRRGLEVNLAMVEQGQALVYRRYCTAPAYWRAEERARRRRLGVWDGAQPFEPPWEWRRGRARARLTDSH